VPAGLDVSRTSSGKGIHGSRSVLVQQHVVCRGSRFGEPRQPGFAELRGRAHEVPRSTICRHSCEVAHSTGAPMTVRV
jgi:hypothetical protein